MEMPLPSELATEPHDDLGDRMPLSLLAANLDEVTLGDPSEGYDEQFVELAVYPPNAQHIEHSSTPASTWRNCVATSWPSNDETRGGQTRR